MNWLFFVQDAKVDVAKVDKPSAGTAAAKQNGLDIVSITSDGCKIFNFPCFHVLAGVNNYCVYFDHLTK